MTQITNSKQGRQSEYPVGQVSAIGICYLFDLRRAQVESYFGD